MGEGALELLGAASATMGAAQLVAAVFAVAVGVAAPVRRNAVAVGAAELVCFATF